MAKHSKQTLYRCLSAHVCADGQIHVQHTRLDAGTRQVVTETVGFYPAGPSPTPTTMHLAIARAATLLSGLPWQEVIEVD